MNGRLLHDSGGWSYYQYENGDIEIIEAPSPYSTGSILLNPDTNPSAYVLTSGYYEEGPERVEQAWRAITAKFGSYREESYIGKGLVLVSLLALLYEIRRRR